MSEPSERCSTADLQEVAQRPRRKIARAVRHFEEAAQQIRSWQAESPVSGRLEARDGRTRIDAIVQTASEPPTEAIALIIGDALHNLRSALDGLAWGLAHLQGVPARPGRIYFPVLTEGGKWSDARRELSSIPAPLLARIEAVQPFKAPDPPTQLLALLHRLDIQDKHHDFLYAKPQLSDMAWENLVLGLDAGTEIKPPLMSPVLPPELQGAVIGSMHFSKPFWDRGELPGSLAVKLSFVVKMETPNIAIPVEAMAAEFPAALEHIVNFVCAPF